MYVICELRVDTCCLTLYLDLNLILTSFVSNFKSFTRFALPHDADWIASTYLNR